MRFTTLAFLVGCTGKADTADTGGDAEADADTDSDTDTDTDTADTDTVGACGEVTKWNLTIYGGVNAVGGQPAEGAHVVLRDRVWNPNEILGETASNAAGLFELNVYDVTSLELCWGTLGYYLEVDDLGTQYADLGVNTSLYGEISEAAGLGMAPPGIPDYDTGVLTVDLTAAFIQMAQTSR